MASAGDAGEIPWVRLLRPPRALADQGYLPPVTPAAASAALEMVRTTNLARAEAGLEELLLDRELTWSALQHCAYLDWASEQGLPPTHVQDPSSPVFSGELPTLRAGIDANEVVAHDTQYLPWESVFAWLQAPFHRGGLIHPARRTVGACATSRGARVMEVAGRPAGRSEEAFLYPFDGQEEVPLTFDGLEMPDPLARWPERTLPVGYPLSAYFELRPHHVTVESVTVTRDGEEVAIYLLTPSDTEPLSTAPLAEVHAIPREPLQQYSTYTWEVSYRIVDLTWSKKQAKKALQLPPRRASATFRSGADPSPGAIDPSPAVVGVVEAVNALRRGQGAPELVADTATVAATELYVHGGESSLRRLLPYQPCGFVCVLTRQLGDPEALAPTMAELLDPRWKSVGATERGRQTCFLAAPPFSMPPRWLLDPPKD
jgi:hypothetical protein